MQQDSSSQLERSLNCDIMLVLLWLNCSKSLWAVCLRVQHAQCKGAAVWVYLQIVYPMYIFQCLNGMDLTLLVSVCLMAPIGELVAGQAGPIPEPNGLLLLLGWAPTSVMLCGTGVSLRRKSEYCLNYCWHRRTIAIHIFSVDNFPCFFDVRLIFSLDFLARRASHLLSGS